MLTFEKTQEAPVLQCSVGNVFVNFEFLQQQVLHCCLKALKNVGGGYGLFEQLAGDTDSCLHSRAAADSRVSQGNRIPCAMLPDAWEGHLGGAPKP